MERIFAGKISNSDEITIKYLDDDGDKVTLLNDSDLTVALHFHKLLRLFVFVNGQEQINSNSANEAETKQGNLIEAKTFRNELQQIRNSVQTILDRLQLPSSGQEKEASTPVAPPPTVVSSTTREFDPFKNASQLQQAAPHQRSTTPDSIRSKSSTSNLNSNNNEQKAFQPASIRKDHWLMFSWRLINFFSLDQHQSVESNNAQIAPPSTYQQPPMSTPQFAQSAFGAGSINDQQAKTNAFGPPPTSAFPGMPPLPNNASAPRFPTAFPNANVLPNTGVPPTFNSAPTPPPASGGQPSAFIGQQAAPPQQGGFYSQQQTMFQQRPPGPGFNPPNANNNYAQQGQPPAMPPASSSSPATINPSFAPPPPMANQQPYGGYAPQNSYYNPMQQYPKTS